jgi:hypothetical protein
MIKNVHQGWNPAGLSWTMAKEHRSLKKAFRALLYRFCLAIEKEPEA